MTRTYHICGCYYTTGPASAWGYAPRVYLPQVELKSHTTILSTSSRTVLSQTFTNPSSEKGIKKLRYTFPLYDGVSVVGFRCIIGDRVITGVVKEKEKARSVFNEAVDRGQQAGLLEQLPDASDVFTTTVGNVPPAARVVVEIIYLGELKNDAQVDGIRFTIPTKISPRYGSYPGQLACSPSDASGESKGMEIVVDVVMPDGSPIKAMQSPSHSIAVSIGTISSAPDAEPKLSQASASLTHGSIELHNDFILQILNKDTGTPKAILETHPTIPNQRALMTSLVPKFSLPQSRPEIVFIADRSGSMRDKIPTLISALQIFLKSLPVGVMFNICSFGGRHSFLWEKSKTYTQTSLDEALNHVQNFSANYGGTEMYQPIEATINNRYGDLPLEVIFLTDGEVWNQEILVDLLNRMVGESKTPIRFFPLGIGSKVSHSLIEGIARAGNGFSQSIGEQEKLDSKVVRMLKGALTPHVGDYSLEIRYGDENKDDDDDFELLDKVEDCLNLNVSTEKHEKDRKENEGKQPISLFDANADPDKEEGPGNDDDGQGRYSHLPALSSPKILQAPNRIPPLFPFNRTSVYLLLSPETTKQIPKSVVLKAASEHGPLQLEVPVTILDSPGETFHQLAAKKAVQELEEGRGWISSARDAADDALLKDKLPGQFQQMVEREAVRLGVQFQVGGKWCSFVAVEANDKAADYEVGHDMAEYEFLDLQDSHSGGQAQESPKYGHRGHGSDRAHMGRGGASTIRRQMAATPASANVAFGSYDRLQEAMPLTAGSGLFSTASAQAPASLSGRPTKSLVLSSTTSFGAFSSVMPPTSSMQSERKEESTSKTIDCSLNALEDPQDSVAPSSMVPGPDLAAPVQYFCRRNSAIGSPGTAKRKARAHIRGSKGLDNQRYESEEEVFNHEEEEPSERPMEALISLQTFEGSWAWDSKLLKALGIATEQANEFLDNSGFMTIGMVERGVCATALAVSFFQHKLGDQQETWELVVEKAESWMESAVPGETLEKLMSAAKKLISGN